MDKWANMKTEYITTDTTYRRLAEKYGVSLSRTNQIGCEDGWVELRRQYRSGAVERAVEKTMEKVSEEKAKQAVRVSELADQLLLKLEQAIGELVTEDSSVDRQGLRQLTAALKELKGIKGEISDLERREREARIEALRRGMAPEQEEDGTGVVLLPGRVENAEC